MFLPTRLNGAFVSRGARLGPEASPALPGEALPWCALPVVLSDEGKQKRGTQHKPQPRSSWMCVCIEVLPVTVQKLLQNSQGWSTLIPDYLPGLIKSTPLQLILRKCKPKMTIN